LLHSWLNLPCLHFNKIDRLETLWFKHHFQSGAPKTFLPSPSLFSSSPFSLLLPLPLLGPFGFDWKPMRQLISRKIEIYLLQVHASAFSFALWGVFSTTISQKQRLPKELFRATWWCASRPISHQYPWPPAFSVFTFSFLWGPRLWDKSTCRGFELKCIDLLLTGNNPIPLCFFLFFASSSP